MTEVDVSCLCGKIQCKLKLTNTLPTALTLCHQTSCRYNLGALCHATLSLPKPPENIELLRRYDCEATSRYFCPTCGSHVFENESGWKIQSGVVGRIHSEQVFGCFDRVASHRYVQETKDGGLSACLTGADTVVADPSLSSVDHAENAELATLCTIGGKPGDEEDAQTHLRASCICGGVQFLITRPNDLSANCSSPWPDLIVPYYSRSPDNPDDVKWWIRDNRKWLAGTCACRSCRLGLGFSIQAWAFVSFANLQATDGLAFSFDTGSLTHFESSKGAVREFCGTCGATIFWHNNERPGVVDVSVGVLRAREGATARSWLEWWTDRVSFAEDALEQKLIASLCSGLPALKQAWTQS